MSNPKTSEPRSYAWPHQRFHKASTLRSSEKQWAATRSKTMSGFCTPYIPLDAQGHEGTRPESRSGVPTKVCPFWDSCPCTCHMEVDQMCEMLGVERQPSEQSPEYTALLAKRSAESRAILDDLVVYAARSNGSSVPDGPMAHPDTLDPSNTPATPATGTSGPRTFDATPTGRRAKGQLEYEVLEVCRDWVNRVYDWQICTPKLVAEAISKKNAIESPSTGAINAVWNRWEKIGFAHQDSKPSRFLRFEGENGPEALDRLKAKSKQATRLGAAADKRGSLRPRR